MQRCTFITFSFFLLYPTRFYRYEPVMVMVYLLFRCLKHLEEHFEWIYENRRFFHNVIFIITYYNWLLNYGYTNNRFDCNNVQSGSFNFDVRNPLIRETSGGPTLALKTPLNSKNMNIWPMLSCCKVTY